jgi:DNA-binding CsgD family transcriptional regulator
LHADEYVSEIGISRGENAPAFTSSEKEYFLALYPHLKRSIQITNTLNETRNNLDISNRTIDAISHGVAVIDRYSEISFSNASFERLLRRTDCITVKGNTLRLTSSFHDAKLKALISESLDSDILLHAERCSGGFSLELPDGEKISILVTPLRQNYHDLFANGKHEAVAVFFISSRNQPAPQELLKSLYGLTPKQAELLEHIAVGYSVSEIANKMQVSSETVKTQLKLVFAKMNVRSQRDLAVLLAKLCVRF